MKRKKKLWLLWIIIPVLLAAIAGGGLYFWQLNNVSEYASMAVYNSMDGQYQYQILKGNKAKIVAYTGSDMDVVIPEEIDGRKVVALGNAIFSSVDTVKIPASIEEMDGNPFYFSRVESIEVDRGNEVFYMQDNALIEREGRRLVCYVVDGEYVTIPDGIRTIGSYCFSLGSFREAYIPDGVRTIEEYAFYECRGLETVTIPDSMRTIGEYAFAHCSFLTNIRLNEGLRTLGDCAFYCAKGGRGTKIQELKIPASVTNIGNPFGKNNIIDRLVFEDEERYQYVGAFLVDTQSHTLIGCTNTGDTIDELPEDIRRIAAGALSGCDFDWDFELPKSLQEIGDYAFARCEFSSELVISGRVKKIGKYAFTEAKVRDVKLGEGISIIDEGMFYKSGVQTIKLPRSLTSIGNDAFLYSSLREVEGGSGLRSIGDRAFGDSNLSTIHLGKKLEHIGKYAFAVCKLTVVELPASLKVVEEGTFRANRLEEITFGRNITQIGKKAFEKNAGLENVKLPTSLKYIGDYAFGECTGIKAISLPKKLKTIQGNPFARTHQLEKITIAAGNKYLIIEDGVLFSKEDKKLIHYLAGRGLERYDVPSGVETISSGAFMSRPELKQIYIPEGLLAIEDSAITYCKNLEKLYLPISVKSLGDQAISECDNVTLVVYEGSYAHTYAKECGMKYEVSAAPVAVVEETPDEGEGKAKELDRKTLISAGYDGTFGVLPDGTVLAVGYNVFGQNYVGTWSDIISISTKWDKTVGLKTDGTIVVVGDSIDNEESAKGWKDIVAVEAGKYHIIGLKADGTVLTTSDEYDVSNWKNIVAIGAGDGFAVGLKKDGTVVATGENSYGQCDVSEWKDIIAISVGLDHTIGLKKDGTVVATGDNECGECNVTSWTDIVAISAGADHTVGLKKDGTVIATDYISDIFPYEGQCDVGDWKEIIAVAAGVSHTVGVTSDGQVLTAGSNEYGQCDVGNWNLMKNLVNPQSNGREENVLVTGYEETFGVKPNGTVVAAGNGSYYTLDVFGMTDVISIYQNDQTVLALKADGTVVSKGANEYGEGNVSDWTDIVSIAMGMEFSVGLKSDGTIVMTDTDDPDLYGAKMWSDIVAIASCDNEIIGLKKDGTVVAAGSDDYGETNVNGWTDIIAIDTNDAYTVGVKRDGTVVITEHIESGSWSPADCSEASNWTDVVAISMGSEHVVGLKKDGTVVATGDNSEGQCDIELWTDIVFIAAGGNRTVGLKADGSVVAVGSNEYGECNVGEWSLRIPIGRNHVSSMEQAETFAQAPTQTPPAENAEETEDVVPQETEFYGSIQGSPFLPMDDEEDGEVVIPPTEESTPVPTEVPPATPTLPPTEEPVVTATPNPYEDMYDIGFVEDMDYAMVDLGWATETPAPAIEDQPVDEPVDRPKKTPGPGTRPIAGTDVAVENIPIKVEANSTVSDTYTGDKATDKNEETCWQYEHSKKTDGKIGLQLWYKPGSVVDEMWIKNGFWKWNKYDQYYQNARPKKVGISFLYDDQSDYQDEVEVTLEDSGWEEGAYWTMVPLGHHENVRGVKLRVISYYKGRKFDEVAISEVMFVERLDSSPAASQPSAQTDTSVIINHEPETQAEEVHYKPLSQGDKGADVLKMKLRMQELGYFRKGTEVSETYTEKCTDRVKDFQKNNGLPATGIADEETLRVLYSDSAVPKN